MKDFLVVDPEGGCTLFGIDVTDTTAHGYWKLDTNCQKTIGDGFGDQGMYVTTGQELTLYFHNHGESKKIEIDIDAIKAELSNCYPDDPNCGADVIHVPFSVDYLTGFARRDDNQNLFRILKSEYKLKGRQWYLNFSKFQAWFPNGEECRVYHTIDFAGFIATCQYLNVRKFHTGQSIRDLEYLNDIRWLKKIEIDDRIVAVGENGTFICKGTFENLHVIIKVIPRAAFSAKMYDNLWLANNCENIVRFYGAELNSTHCLLAFEECQLSLYEFVTTSEFNLLLQNNSWTKFMRGILRGLLHLHRLGIAHMNLNLYNILVTEGLVARIAGFGKSQSIDDHKRATDIQTLGEIVHLCFNPCYAINDSVALLNQDLPVEPQEFAEVYDAIGKLKNNSYERHILKEVIDHPWLWKAEKRLRFLKDASDVIQEEANALPNLKIGLEYLNVFPGGRWIDQIWSLFYNEMNRNRPGQAPVYTDSVYDFLRFVRNYIGHRGSLRNIDYHYLGWTDDQMEQNLRIICPRLYIEIYYHMRTYLNGLPIRSAIRNYY